MKKITMKKIVLSLFILLFTISLSLTLFEDSEAKRFGGGRSFGGSRSYSQPAPKPTTPNRDSNQQYRDSNQQNTKPNQANPNSVPPQGSRFGGMGGMLGGLLMGGLLGSMLFGGAFGGIGFLDILLIGLVLFFGLRFLRSRMAAKENLGFQGAGNSSGSHTRSAREEWEALKNKMTTPSSSPQGNSSFANSSQADSRADNQNDNSFGGGSLDLPKGFDVKDFIEGAKTAYIKIQEGWDQRDVSHISFLLTPEMMLQVRKQLEESLKKGKTELLKIDAELVSFKQNNDKDEAGVYFAVLMLEDENQESFTAHELWTFVRDKGENWLLDGIQQIEE
ncbi:Tim44 domain-containing protein [Desulfovibrio litoralis]|uniref:Predicted lipid-binding transport protein, Tim44 family n=1 Tax=Desulfovibrio litoralis DSM 11393 TaxID=1121455 RepID=A0A1M7SRV3_9BACT|nr:Tim44-like domain-containing protein [Desulfovibrio litoralis]SHN61151.1 Predicted lipid-binding transport protein, Tim44 family [Desulfovibrio litoralis DSM 11393]